MSVTSSRSILTYFSWAFSFTALGLLLSLWVGWRFTGTVQGMWSVFFICLVLSILEISLSFDNAVVNANILKRMDPVWQKRFLTWGILIAVFGMRIVFPVMVVSIAAGTGPIEALKLAVSNPDRYADIMHVAHPKIAAFGGAFLLMVALSFFFDPDKDEHWFGPIERGCALFGDARCRGGSGPCDHIDRGDALSRWRARRVRDHGVIWHDDLLCGRVFGPDVG